MTDTFNVTASYDKTTYNAGDTITVSISGDDVLTTTSQGQAGPLTIHVSAGSATQDITLPSEGVTITTSTHEPVVITGVTDNSPTPRVWTVAANGLSATSTA